MYNEKQEHECPKHDVLGFRTKSPRSAGPRSDFVACIGLLYFFISFPSCFVIVEVEVEVEVVEVEVCGS